MASLPAATSCTKLPRTVLNGIDDVLRRDDFAAPHGCASDSSSTTPVARKIGAKLRVIGMEGYTRDLLFTDTDLTWHAPSPNLPTPDAALLYPATGLLEASNLSVRRGTR